MWKRYEYGKKERKEVSYEQALSKLTTLCAKSEHSTGEIREKMRKMGLPESEQERLLDFLLEHSFVDDERFGRAFIEDKLQFNGWGRRKIKEALYLKGIKGSLADKLLREIDKKRFQEILKPVLSAKLPTIEAKNDYERMTKLFRFALGRGFTAQEVYDCIQSLDVDGREGDFSTPEGFEDM